MESNYTDKEMRDKLKSVEFPFDPKAWEQMEIMMDERKKQAGFFWWWFGGITACLLMAGAIGYETMKSSQLPSVAISQTQELHAAKNNRETAGNQQQAITNPEVQSAVNTNANALKMPATHRSVVADEGERRPANSSEPFSSANKPGALKPATKRANYGLAKSLNSQQPSLSSSANGFLNAGNGNSLNKEGNAGANNVTLASTAQASAEPEENVPAIRSAAAFSPIYIQTMNAFVLKGTVINNHVAPEENEDDVRLPKNKKIFHYSIGVAANVTFTTLGNQSNGQMSDPGTHTSYTIHPHVSGAPFYYQQPSYAAGLTQEFMFFRRFAITSSLLLAQTSYRVFYTDNPYTANITGFDIPLGLKAYPVSKSRFRFYIESGFINHLALNRSLTYPPSYERLGLINNNPPTSSSTETVKINEYYASFYASSGVEFIIKNHFILFTAPLFYISLNKVTGLENHQYNMGLNAGFRYRF